MMHPQAMFAAILVIAVQSAPPQPDPPEPAWIEAAAIFRDNPISDEVRQDAIDRAVSQATSKAFQKTRLKYDFDKFERLRKRIGAYVPADHAKLDDDVAKCMTEVIAFKLDLDEIRQVRKFMKTTAGSKFWRVVSYPQVVACYGNRLILGATDEDYRAAGLKPPRHIKMKPEKGHSVS